MRVLRRLTADEMPVFAAHVASTYFSRRPALPRVCQTCSHWRTVRRHQLEALSGRYTTEIVFPSRRQPASPVSTMSAFSVEPVAITSASGSRSLGWRALSSAACSAIRSVIGTTSINSEAMACFAARRSPRLAGPTRLSEYAEAGSFRSSPAWRLRAAAAALWSASPGSSRAMSTLASTTISATRREAGRGSQARMRPACYRRPHEWPAAGAGPSPPRG